MGIYVVTLAVLGAGILFKAWLPMALGNIPLCLPIFRIVLGAILAWSPFPASLASTPSAIANSPSG
jgi:hypothetical protein